MKLQINKSYMIAIGSISIAYYLYTIYTRNYKHDIVDTFVNELKIKNNCNDIIKDIYESLGHATHDTSIDTFEYMLQTCIDIEDVKIVLCKSYPEFNCIFVD